MNFLWPEFLWLLLALPLLVLLYLWLLRRKKKMALRYASLSIVKEAMGAGQTARRHIPPALFLLALGAMLLAAACVRVVAYRWVLFQGVRSSQGQRLARPPAPGDQPRRPPPEAAEDLADDRRASRPAASSGGSRSRRYRRRARSPTRSRANARATRGRSGRWNR